MIDSAELDALAVRLAAGIPPQLLDAGVLRIAESLQDPVTAAMQDEEPERTGALKENTAARASALPGAAALLETRSSAENSSGQFYARWVFTQHRIVAWGHDTGRLSTPNAFPTRALERVSPEITAAVAAGAAGIGALIARILA